MLLIPQHELVFRDPRADSILMDIYYLLGFRLIMHWATTQLRLTMLCQCIRLLTMNVFGEDLIKTGKTEHGNKNTVPLNSELIKIKLIDQ